MGERGPAPRREDERRRRNKTDPVTKVTREVLDALPFEVDYEPEPPEFDLPAAEPGDDDVEQWHPIVQGFWNDMKRDPARMWMTSGDWAALALFAESLSRELRPQVVGKTETGEVITAHVPPRAATLAAFLKILEHLGVTESARLRMQKEVSLFPPQAEPAETSEDGKVVPISTRRKSGVQ